MPIKMFQFLHNFFRSSWKGQFQKQSLSQTLSRHNHKCVLKSVSSRSSLSVTTDSSFSSRNSCSIDGINFEFRANQGEPDLCCVRQCCEKCFCEEGEALAEDLRKKEKYQRRRRLRWRSGKKYCPRWTENGGRKYATNRCSSPQSRSSDSAGDVTSTSSCENSECRHRKRSASVQCGVPIQAFLQMHATACVNVNDETTIPSYENLPDIEHPYDLIPSRPPRAITEPPYENVLVVNCMDACVFRQIWSIFDTSPSHLQIAKSLEQLHKDYGCVRRTSTADNEINYYFENYDEFENDLNMELERRLSD